MEMLVTWGKFYLRVEIGAFKTGPLFYSNLSTGWRILASLAKRINIMILILYHRISLVIVITVKQNTKPLEWEFYCFCSCYLHSNVSVESPKNLTTKLFALLNPKLLNKSDRTKLKCFKTSFRFSSCICDAFWPQTKVLWKEQRQLSVERFWPFSKVACSFICLLNYSSSSFMINKLQSSCLHWITSSSLTFLFCVSFGINVVCKVWRIHWTLLWKSYTCKKLIR